MIAEMREELSARIDGVQKEIKKLKIGGATNNNAANATFGVANLGAIMRTNTGNDLLGAEASVNELKTKVEQHH